MCADPNNTSLPYYLREGFFIPTPSLDLIRQTDILDIVILVMLTTLIYGREASISGQDRQCNEGPPKFRPDAERSLLQGGSVYH